MSFTRAIVRPPARTFASGLSSADSGAPDLALAMQQHSKYVEALIDCGVAIKSLSPEDAFPDGTFVEDTAIATGRGAVLTRPGAPSRAGEVARVAPALREFYADTPAIVAPGTLDGGDVCEADGHFLIGLSARTNADGAAQLSSLLDRWGYSSSTIDIRSHAALLHLKSGIAYLDCGLWVIDSSFQDELRRQHRVSAKDVITVSADEAYGANCLSVNGSVFLASGHPGLLSELESRGRRVLQLDVSEFKKMDGGLSCLSLRF